MRRIVSVMALLALAACGRGEEASRQAGPPPAPAARVESDVPVQPASYVGRWAARPDLCAAGAWVFEDRGVTTAGEVSCRFEEVTPRASGYRVRATCVAQAPPEAHEITLTLTDPAPPQRMTVAGGPWDGPVTLVRCAAP